MAHTAASFSTSRQPQLTGSESACVCPAPPRRPAPPRPSTAPRPLRGSGARCLPAVHGGAVASENPGGPRRTEARAAAEAAACSRPPHRPGPWRAWNTTRGWAASSSSCGTGTAYRSVGGTRPAPWVSWCLPPVSYPSPARGSLGQGLHATPPRSGDAWRTTLAREPSLMGGLPRRDAAVRVRVLLPVIPIQPCQCLQSHPHASSPVSLQSVIHPCSALQQR